MSAPRLTPSVAAMLWTRIKLKKSAAHRDKLDKQLDDMILRCREATLTSLKHEAFGVPHPEQATPPRQQLKPLKVEVAKEGKWVKRRVPTSNIDLLSQPTPFDDPTELAELEAEEEELEPDTLHLAAGKRCCVGRRELGAFTRPIARSRGLPAVIWGR